MDSKMIATSKWLAYALRHAPELAISKCDRGWVRLADLERAGPYSDIEILYALSADQKGRFEAFCSYGVFHVRATSCRSEPSLWERVFEPRAPLGHPQQLSGGHAAPPSSSS